MATPRTSSTRVPRKQAVKPSTSRRVPASPVRSPSRAPLASVPSAQGAAREAFRDALLGAGERVFGRRRYYATRMVDIAREAGVSVGTLYNYFDGKEVMFSEMLSAMHREFMRQLVSVDVGSDPLERLRAIVESSLAMLEQHAGLLSVFNERGG